jgi:transcriptional regulator with XRE-family HTH domain
MSQTNLNSTSKIMRRRFGSKVQLMRESVGKTQRDMAEALNLDYYTMVSQIERGVSKIPVQDVAKWAELLQQPLRDFTVLYMYWNEPALYTGLFGTDPIVEQGLPKEMA